MHKAAGWILACLLGFTSNASAQKHAPLWFKGKELTPTARMLIKELRNAESRGLRSTDYAVPKIEALSVQQANSVLTRVVERFVMDLHAGRVDPRDVGYDIDVPPARLDVSSAVSTLASTSDVSAALDALEPSFRHYKLLKQALRVYRKLAADQRPRSPMLDERVRKIELTLERVRWLLPTRLDSPPIIVNIPQFRLFAFRTTDDFAQDILQMDVIVGSTFEGRQTPVFAADMRYVVLSPYWDVPSSILSKELLPLIKAKPRWIKANGYEIVRGQSDNAKVMPVTPENITLLAAGKLRLRQKPGPKNALGSVKFMLPNRHSVYLHDTPAHALFKESRRAFSHGCIRVSNPFGLLTHVLRDDPEWTPARITEAFAAGQTLRIPLRKPIRVYMIYGTAMATEAGKTLFFDDIYKHDARLQTLLDARSKRLKGVRR